jgi:hypothetical protein
MQRDMVLVTAILNGTASLDFNTQISLDEVVKGVKEDNVEPKFERDLILEHINVLVKEGFIEGRISTDGYLLLDATIWRLTWKGQDLLANLMAR